MKTWKVEDEEWPDINFPLIKSCFQKKGELSSKNRENGKSRLLVMYANPCGLGIWDFALLPHKSSDYYILFYMGV